jgi:hypothetical protein
LHKKSPSQAKGFSTRSRDRTGTAAMATGF